MKLPLTFSGTAIINSDTQQIWSIKSGDNKVECSIPKDFGGPGLGFSPEDFFLQALINCFLGTFKISANLSKVVYNSLNVYGEIVLDSNENKQTVIKNCVLKITARGVVNRDRFTHMVNKVMKSGFILNSVKTEINYELSFESE